MTWLHAGSAPFAQEHGEPGALTAEATDGTTAPGTAVAVLLDG